MEKAVSLFKDGERMTPIMQKIEDLRSAITRYNRVTAKRAKPKIGFAYGIILFADDAIEELEIYLDDLKQNKCHDALSRSGVITLDKLMSLRAQKIAEFVNGETLTW